MAQEKPEIPRRNERERRTPQENATLDRLYRSSHGSPEHGAAEADFNREREKRLRAEGFEGEYRPQRDVRHEFEFTRRHDEATGVTETIARSKGPLRRPEEVINWRHTQVGKEADDRARRVYHGSGDDAGHLISPEFGADPGDPRNLASQHFVANQQGNFKDFENDCKGRVAGQTVPHEIEVHLRARDDGSGEREYVRTMKLYRRDSDGGREVVNECIFANPTSQARRAADAGGQPDRAADWELHRENKTALAAPDLEARQAEWARLKRRNSADLTPEEKLQMREEMRERAIEGGRHKKKEH